jgi:hypothetical protein
MRGAGVLTVNDFVVVRGIAGIARLHGKVSLYLHKRIARSLAQVLKPCKKFVNQKFISCHVFLHKHKMVFCIGLRQAVFNRCFCA